MTIGGGIAVALGLTAVGVTVPRLFGKHYRKSPYDDLLAQLIDRDAAAKVGKAALQGGGIFPDPADLARELRGRLERRSLADVTASDLDQSNLVEVRGWVLPQTLVLLSVLAAEQDG